MSDSYISIVPKVKEYPHHKQKAGEIINWLTSRDIIKTHLSDCTLGKDLGYAVSEGAKKVVEEPEYLPFDLITNGLEVITEMNIFHPGEFADEMDEDVRFPESDLGFTFWNWPPLKNEFIEEFRQQLGMDVEVIIGQI
jgi:hypothetical protein